MTDSSPWHDGEVRIQAKAGSRERMTQICGKLIRTFMPDQHRKFFQQLQMVILGAADQSGEILATALFGETGFVSTPDDQTLLIRATLPASDPLAGHLQKGSRVGLLGIDLSTSGKAGFIRTDTQGRLLVPDYPGNGFFNTLGNLHINPQAELLFLDFQQGHSLHLSVTAETLWQQAESQLCGEAERLLCLTVNQGCRIHNRLPLLFKPDQ